MDKVFEPLLKKLNSIKIRLTDDKIHKQYVEVRKCYADLCKAAGLIVENMGHVDWVYDTVKVYKRPRSGMLYVIVNEKVRDYIRYSAPDNVVDAIFGFNVRGIF